MTAPSGSRRRDTDLRQTTPKAIQAAAAVAAAVPTGITDLHSAARGALRNSLNSRNRNRRTPRATMSSRIRRPFRMTATTMTTTTRTTSGTSAWSASGGCTSKNTAASRAGRGRAGRPSDPDGRPPTFPFALFPFLLSIYSHRPILGSLPSISLVLLTCRSSQAPCLGSPRLPVPTATRLDKHAQPRLSVVSSPPLPLVVLCPTCSSPLHLPCPRLALTCCSPVFLRFRYNTRFAPCHR